MKISSKGSYPAQAGTQAFDIYLLEVAGFPPAGRPSETELHGCTDTEESALDMHRDVVANTSAWVFSSAGIVGAVRFNAMIGWGIRSSVDAMARGRAMARESTGRRSYVYISATLGDTRFRRPVVLWSRYGQNAALATGVSVYRRGVPRAGAAEPSLLALALLWSSSPSTVGVRSGAACRSSRRCEVVRGRGAAPAPGSAHEPSSTSPSRPAGAHGSPEGSLEDRAVRDARAGIGHGAAAKGRPGPHIPRATLIAVIRRSSTSSSRRADADESAVGAAASTAPSRPDGSLLRPNVALAGAVRRRQWMGALNAGQWWASEPFHGV